MKVSTQLTIMLTGAEITTLRKMIGATSHYDRVELGLTENESNQMHEMHCQLSSAIEESE